MVKRVSFLLIALFWVAMNGLLWRSEFGGGGELGSAVPVSLVWEKVLTAPDDSSLEINSHGKKIGYCRWLANVGEELSTGKLGTEEVLPEGMVRQLAGYTIDLEGSFLREGHSGRLRFDLHGRFAADHAWQELAVRANLRPTVWELRALSADESLTLKVEDDESRWEQRFAFADLRQPEKLLKELGFPAWPGLFNPALILPAPQDYSLGLNWEARNDWLKIGHSQVRVYRLQARLLDRYQAVVIVSRVGEILRVELPNDLVLVNDALIDF